MAANTNPTLTIVAVTAGLGKGKILTLHVAPKRQKESTTKMRSRARRVLRRLLNRSNIRWSSFSTALKQMSSSNAKRVCTFKDPKSGSARFAVC